MKISNAKNINKVKIPTYRDLADGDVFIFLGGEQEDEIMLNTSCDYLVRLCDGEVYDKYDFENIPVKKLNCCLVIED